jgi:hypothetical protein
MLDVPRYGVWHFQFGDWTHYRGGPAGFWEVYDGASVSGALLTRVLPTATRSILRDGFFRTEALSYTARNRNNIARA